MNGAPTRLVLFVCVENTLRSVIAAPIFNAHAPSGWHAGSAGVTPADSINPVAVELLEEIGIKVAHGKPRVVTRYHLRLHRPLPSRRKGEVRGLADPRKYGEG